MRVAGFECGAFPEPRLQGGWRSREHRGANRRDHALSNQIPQEVRLRAVLKRRSQDQAMRWVGCVLVLGGERIVVE